MGARSKVYNMSQSLENIFPNLRLSNYSVESPATIDYNCIAWAAGDTGAFWWPDSMNIGFWPANIPREENLNAFIRAFESIGYSECESPQLETNFEKIAIYVKNDGKPAHAARQLESGMWTSKIGRLEDIEHVLEALSGDIYGYVTTVMKRERRDPM